MSEEKDYSGFKPAEYSTFEKGQQLLAMAKRDEKISEILLSGSKEEKLRVFAQAGLTEAEVEDALKAIDDTFGADVKAVRPW